MASNTHCPKVFRNRGVFVRSHTGGGFATNLADDGSPPIRSPLLWAYLYEPNGGALRGQLSRSTPKPMKPRRFNGAGRPGTCCAHFYTPRSSLRPTRCRWSAGPSREDAAESTTDRFGGRLLATLTTDPSRGDAATGSNVTAPLSSPHCWRDYAPMNCCAPTSATFAVATMGPSSMFVARAARTAESQSNGRWSRFSSIIWIAGRPASLPPQAALPRQGLGRLAAGRTVVRRAAWRTDLPRRAAIPGAACLSPRRHRRRPCTRRTRPRVTPHLRH